MKYYSGRGEVCTKNTKSLSSEGSSLLKNKSEYIDGKLNVAIEGILKN